ncbi:unnamed protein product [Timema podura]|uniref:DNA polymerase alpha/delta/epsilon subunit B domain-containing protein n=1 Tax=Timema podura TaxID=61482 RepID=A0ABN7NR84_TIMPD|nr:unnamed protein product [Timema podura]
MDTSSSPQKVPGDEDDLAGVIIPNQTEVDLNDWIPVVNSHLDADGKEVAGTSRLLFLTVEYVEEPTGDYGNSGFSSFEPVASFSPHISSSLSEFEQRVSPLDPNMSSAACYSPVYTIDQSPTTADVNQSSNPSSPFQNQMVVLPNPTSPLISSSTPSSALSPSGQTFVDTSHSTVSLTGGRIIHTYVTHLSSPDSTLPILSQSETEDGKGLLQEVEMGGTFYHESPTGGSPHSPGSENYVVSSSGTLLNAIPSSAADFVEAISINVDTSPPGVVDSTSDLLMHSSQLVPGAEIVYSETNSAQSPLQLKTALTTRRPSSSFLLSMLQNIKWPSLKEINSDNTGFSVIIEGVDESELRGEQLQESLNINEVNLELTSEPPEFINSTLLGSSVDLAMRREVHLERFLPKSYQETYPSAPPVWFAESEETSVTSAVHALSNTSGRDNHSVSLCEQVLNQVGILLRELCLLHGIPEPPDLALLTMPVPQGCYRVPVDEERDMEDEDEEEEDDGEDDLHLDMEEADTKGKVHSPSALTVLLRRCVNSRTDCCCPKESCGQESTSRSVLCRNRSVSAARYKTLHGVSNPYQCDVGGRRFLGTSGQPLDDIARYSKLEDPLEILEQTLEWGHLSPTSPDTLGKFYHYDGSKR